MLAGTDELPGSDSEGASASEQPKRGRKAAGAAADDSSSQEAASDGDDSDCEVIGEAATKSGSEQAEALKSASSEASESEPEAASPAKEAACSEASSGEEEPPAKQGRGRRASRQPKGRNQRPAKQAGAADSGSDDAAKVVLSNRSKAATCGRCMVTCMHACPQLKRKIICLLVLTRSRVQVISWPPSLL